MSDNRTQQGKKEYRMAKVNGNIFMAHLSGMIGDQLVIKRARGGRTINSKKPTFRSDRVFSAAQLAQQQAFREATAYARAMKREPIYLAKANDSAQTGYNVAVADWFNRPEILEIDLSGWTTEGGGVIRVRAQEDVKVQQVKVVISEENGALLEEGLASETGALWWEYQTAQPAAQNLRVTTAAMDLPGHVTKQAKVKKISG
jgi:hypothetical protein